MSLADDIQRANEEYHSYGANVDPQVKAYLEIEQTILKLADEAGIGPEIRKLYNVSAMGSRAGGALGGALGAATAGTSFAAMGAWAGAVGATVGAVAGIVLAVLDIFGDDEGEARAKARAKARQERAKVEGSFLTYQSFSSLIAEQQQQVNRMTALLKSSAELDAITNGQFSQKIKGRLTAARDNTAVLVSTLGKIKVRVEGSPDKGLFEGALNIARWDQIQFAYLDREKRLVANLAKYRQSHKLGQGGTVLQGDPIESHLLKEIQSCAAMRGKLNALVSKAVTKLSEATWGAGAVYTAIGFNGQVLAKFELSADGFLRALALDKQYLRVHPSVRVSGVGATGSTTMADVLKGINDEVMQSAAFLKAWTAAEEYVSDAVPLALTCMDDEAIDAMDDLVGSAEYGDPEAQATLGVAMEGADQEAVCVGAIASAVMNARGREGGIALLQSIASATKRLELACAGDADSLKWAEEIVSAANGGDEGACIALGVMVRVELELAEMHDMAEAEASQPSEAEKLDEEYGGVPASSLEDAIVHESTVGGADLLYGGVPAESLCGVAGVDPWGYEPDPLGAFGCGDVCVDVSALEDPMYNGVPHTGDVGGEDWAGDKVSPIGFYGAMSVDENGLPVDVPTMLPAEEFDSIPTCWDGVTVSPLGMYGPCSIATDGQPVLESTLLDPEDAYLMGCGDVSEVGGIGDAAKKGVIIFGKAVAAELSKRLSALGAMGGMDTTPDQGGVGFNPQPDPPGRAYAKAAMLSKLKYGANKLGGPDTAW